MNKEQELIEKAKRRYPIGCKINQTTAYNGSGNKSIELKEFKPAYYNGNFSIDGVGVYSDQYKIWAEVVEYPKNYVAPSENLLSKLEIW